MRQENIGTKSLRVKMAVGYVLILLLVGGIVHIWLGERQEMETLEEVTVTNALNTPKIVFTPKKAMRDAANSVELSIDRSKVTAAGSTSDSDEEGGSPLG